MHKVTLGPSDGKNTVITSGLAAGNVVVTDGTDRLSDGAKIQAAGARPASGAAAAERQPDVPRAARGAHGASDCARSGPAAASADAAS